jgi:hypothetical protein
MVDEFSLVEPLKVLLDEVLCSADTKDKKMPKVVWYPPPTEMEQAFSQMSMPGAPF